MKETMVEGKREYCMCLGVLLISVDFVKYGNISGQHTQEVTKTDDMTNDMQEKVKLARCSK